jgi:hypothetical protein
VDPRPRQGVQVDGEGRRQGFAFAGFHFGDFSLMEDHSSDELDIEGAHPDPSFRRFPDDGKRLDEEIVQRGPVRQPRPELVRSLAEFRVRQAWTTVRGC